MTRRLRRSLSPSNLTLVRIMPVATTVREATADERAVIARRSADRRQIVPVAIGGEAKWLAPFFALSAIASTLWLVRAPSAPAAFTLVLALAFAVLWSWGARNGARRKRQALAEIDSREVALGRSVTEYRIESDRVVVMSERDGDDETFWFFRDASDHTWLGVEDGQWIDLDVGTRTWNREVRISVDQEGRVVSIISAGTPVSVEHHELQPPDYMPQADTLFWTRPEDLGPAPFVLRTDPLGSAGPL